jgi:putative endonuclease
LSPSVKSNDSGKSRKNRSLTNKQKSNSANQSRKSGPDAPSHESCKGDARHELGAAGETRAANFLRRRGYLILERNVRYDGVEVDLIARRGRSIVFVEVKTRRTTRFGSPQLAVDRRKQARLVRAASAWLATHRAGALKIRFDVVACLVTGRFEREHWEIEHLIGAFDAG